MGCWGCYDDQNDHVQDLILTIAGHQTFQEEQAKLLHFIPNNTLANDEIVGLILNFIRQFTDMSTADILQHGMFHISLPTQVPDNISPDLLSIGRKSCQSLYYNAFLEDLIPRTARLNALREEYTLFGGDLSTLDEPSEQEYENYGFRRF